MEVVGAAGAPQGARPDSKYADSKYATGAATSLVPSATPVQLKETEMANASRLRRLSAAIAVGGFTVLVLVAPASARPDPGEHTTSDGSVLVSREVKVPVDDNALEVAQIGLGALAGVAVAGAGAAAVGLKLRQRASRPV